jgi:hypothetical protein
MKWILLLALSCAPFWAKAATTPEEAVKSYAGAFAREDYAAAAAMMRPADVRLLRTFFASRIVEGGDEASRRRFFGDASAAELAKLDDVHFVGKLFAAMLMAGTDRVRFEETRILGAVADGPDTTYVVVKQKATIGGHAFETVEASPTVREGGQWFVAMPKQFESIVRMLEQRPVAPSGTKAGE